MAYNCFYYGSGTEHNYGEAFKWYKTAAENINIAVKEQDYSFNNLI